MLQYFELKLKLVAIEKGEDRDGYIEKASNCYSLHIEWVHLGNCQLQRIRLTCLCRLQSETKARWVGLNDIIGY